MYHKGDGEDNRFFLKHGFQQFPFAFSTKKCYASAVTKKERDRKGEGNMREFRVTLQEESVLSKVICNGCGREIPLERADYFHGEKTWGYFSEKDGRQDSFDLCEECYDKMMETFKIKGK